MKTIKQKRLEAIARMRHYKFVNSKASRNGVDEATWQAQLDKQIAYLEGLVK